jgi:hypothetical protein
MRDRRNESVVPPRVVLFQTRAGEATEFEREYLQTVLLAQTPHVCHLDGGAMAMDPKDAVVVVSSNDQTGGEEWKRYFDRGRPAALLHLSDEKLQTDPELYREFPLVLRSYWHPRVAGRNIYAVPLGFQSGFLGAIHQGVEDEERKISWAFIGQIKSHRERMVADLSRATRGFVHRSSAWSSADQLSVAEAARVYRNTVFAPCPFGNVNPDSFRIMEALECGCIPVVVRFAGIDYYRYVFGDHPFVIGGDWREVAGKMRKFLDQPSLLRREQREVEAWYRRFKEALGCDVAAMLEGERSHFRSSQFAYQQEPGLSPAEVHRFYAEIARPQGSAVTRFRRRCRRFIRRTCSFQSGTALEGSR